MQAKKYIEAEEFLSRINTLRVRGIGNKPTEWHNAMLSVLEAIRQAPAADVRENRHGHWIMVTRPGRDGNAMYRCSRCSASDDHAVAVMVPFCWRCGAEMALDYVEEDLEDEDDQ